jgi:hypothetical protein
MTRTLIFLFFDPVLVGFGRIWSESIVKVGTRDLERGKAKVQCRSSPLQLLVPFFMFPALPPFAGAVIAWLSMPAGELEGFSEIDTQPDRFVVFDLPSQPPAGTI